MARLTGADMAYGEWFMFCMLLLVYGGSTLLLNHMLPGMSCEKNAFFHCVRTLVLLMTLVVFAKDMKGSVGGYAGFSAVTVYLFCEIYRSFRDELQDGRLFYCLMGVNCLAYCTIVCSVFRLESYLPYYAAAVLLAAFFEKKQGKNSMVGNIVVCLLFVWSGWAWLHTEVFYAVLVALPLFAYGYAKKNRIFSLRPDLFRNQFFV